MSFGLIKAIRTYNLLSLIYAVLCMTEMFVKSFNLPVFATVTVNVLQCFVLLVFIPVLERGVKKWTT